MLWKKETRTRNRTRRRLQIHSDPAGTDPDEIIEKLF